MDNICSWIFFILVVCPGNSQFYKEKYRHVPTDLSINELPNLLRDVNIKDFQKVLEPILVERVPGTESHAKVKNFISESMLELGWSVQHDAFVDSTPTFGSTNFTNIVAKLNPKANRYLVISAHYDSKWFPEGNFVGATDSAVPCAMMIYIAQTLKEHLEKFKSSDLSLMFIFFDGEEAFDEWTEVDSLYGSRHLADVWSGSSYPANSKTTTELHRMDVLILLDLIGAANPTFYSYFRNTYSHYHRLVLIEEKLTKANLIHKANKRARYFKEKSSTGAIGDDHVPFMRKGVDIVHIITNPFPDVWHTTDDNESVIDYLSVIDVTKILQIFILEYLKYSP